MNCLKFHSTKKLPKKSRALSCDFIEIFLQSYVMGRRPEVFCKKGVLKNFAKFSGKHLCQSPFFNKVAGLRHIEHRTQNTCGGCICLLEKKLTKSVLQKKVFLKISQNSQEKTCVGVSLLIKLLVFKVKDKYTFFIRTSKISLRLNVLMST